MNKEEWKGIIKDATGEVLEEVKGEGTEFITETIRPAIKEAKDEFTAHLKDEAKEAKSVWVKVRNYSIILFVEIGAKVLDKIFNKVFTSQN